MSKVFIDTKILVYALDGADPEKQTQARALLKSIRESDSGVLSTQVLQEFFVVATGKLIVNPQAAKEMTFSLANFETVTVDLPIISQAIDICCTNNISFWDSLIISAAATSGCRMIWTEDMNHNQMVKGVFIENPFK